MAYKRPQTNWPNGGYYFLRLIQLLASAVVLGAMAYFVIRLIKDHLGVPYEFWVLIAVSIVSLVNIVLSTVFKCCGRLNPAVAAGIDLFLLAAWGAGFGLLTRAMGHTILNSCTNGNWGPAKGEGVWVCKAYKVTWGCCIAAIVGFLGGAILDIFVARRKASHKYVPANPRSMQQQKAKHTPDYQQDTAYGSGGLGAHGAHE